MAKKNDYVEELKIVLLKVQTEFADLSLKIERLERFLDESKAAVSATGRGVKALLKDGWRFKGVTITHLAMLHAQKETMCVYRSILSDRMKDMRKTLRSQSKKRSKKA